MQDFWNLVNNPAHVSVNLLGNDSVDAKEIDGCSVLIIEVPRALRKQRPIYLGPNPLKGTYRRYNEGDYQCSEDEVRRMLADQSEDSADTRVLPHFSLDDLHQQSLDQYRNRFAARASAHPWLEENEQGLLQKLGGWRKDRETGAEGLTVAGLLMFGNEAAITDPAAVPEFHIDYREHQSDEAQERWADRIWADGTWNGNLYQFFARVYPRLVADLKIPFQYQTTPDESMGTTSVQRRDETVVHEAIREALVNCLIHGDYRGQGGIVIDRYPDRLEFSDPGTLLLSFDQLRTLTRNC